MAKPTDLTSKAWNKAKGLTVPKTGFGEKLDAYAAAKKKTEDLPTRNLKTFDAAAAALDAITKHVPVALAKCNKTLHKDTIDSLGAYKGLVSTESGALHSSFVKYQGYVDAFKHRRVLCAQEQAIIEKQMDTAGKKAIADVKKEIASSNLPGAGKVIKAAIDELKLIQDAADKALEKPRLSRPAIEAPHPDDQPDMSVFTALINKQQEIIGVRKDFEAEMKTLLQDAVSKLKK